LSCTKNGVFLQLAAEKKAPFWVQLKQPFGPSYFVKALGKILEGKMIIEKTSLYFMNF
jgi:hypothetical protein